MSVAIVVGPAVARRHVNMLVVSVIVGIMIYRIALDGRGGRAAEANRG